MSSRLVKVNDILAGHVTLDIECLDRIYLKGYVPNLQVGGQVVQYLRARGFPIPSPAIIEMGLRFTPCTRSRSPTTSRWFGSARPTARSR